VLATRNRSCTHDLGRTVIVNRAGCAASIRELLGTAEAKAGSSVLSLPRVLLRCDLVCLSSIMFGGDYRKFRKLHYYLEH
jgi:hypothetical protein